MGLNESPLPSLITCEFESKNSKMKGYNPRPNSGCQLSVIISAGADVANVFEADGLAAMAFPLII